VTGVICERRVNAVTTELRSLDGVSAMAVDLVSNDTSLVTVISAHLLADDVVSAALDEADDYRTANSLSTAATGREKNPAIHDPFPDMSANGWPGWKLVTALWALLSVATTRPVSAGRERSACGALNAAPAGERNEANRSAR
jgi:copper chaperone